MRSLLSSRKRIQILLILCAFTLMIFSKTGWGWFIFLLFLTIILP